jgi:hypothetical protein
VWISLDAAVLAWSDRLHGDGDLETNRVSGSNSSPGVSNKTIIGRISDMVSSCSSKTFAMQDMPVAQR